jgi:hypothetical protein
MVMPTRHQLVLTRSSHALTGGDVPPNDVRNPVLKLKCLVSMFDVSGFGNGVCAASRFSFFVVV